MAEAVTSFNTKLYYSTDGGEEYIWIENLREFPSIGGSVSSIDITCLKDKAYVYTKGLISYGDALEWKVLYDKETFLTLNAIDDTVAWKIELQDGSTCTFSGTCSVSLEGTGIDAEMNFILSIQPSSEMVWA